MDWLLLYSPVNLFSILLVPRSFTKSYMSLLADDAKQSMRVTGELEAGTVWANQYGQSASFFSLFSLVCSLVMR